MKDIDNVSDGINIYYNNATNELGIGILYALNNYEVAYFLELDNSIIEITDDWLNNWIHIGEL